MDFLILINPFTTNHGYWKINIDYILTKSSSPLDRNEIKMDLMLVNMKNIFPLISTIMCYPAHPETLVEVAVGVDGWGCALGWFTHDFWHPGQKS